MTFCKRCSASATPAKLASQRKMWTSCCPPHRVVERVNLCHWKVEEVQPMSRKRAHFPSVSLNGNIYAIGGFFSTSSTVEEVMLTVERLVKLPATFYLIFLDEFYPMQLRHRQERMAPGRPAEFLRPKRPFDSNLRSRWPHIRRLRGRHVLLRSRVQCVAPKGSTAISWGKFG